MTTLTKDTLIPLGLAVSLAITLIGAAVSFGVMYQKVETFKRSDEEVAALREDVAQIKIDVAVIKNEILRRQSEIGQR